MCGSSRRSAMAPAQRMCGGIAEAAAVGGDEVRHVDKAGK